MGCSSRLPSFDAALRGHQGAGFQLKPGCHRSFFGAQSLNQALSYAGMTVLEMGTPFSLLESVSLACQAVPALDPEPLMHGSLRPAALFKAGALAFGALFCMPRAWRRCRQGEGLILHVVAGKKPLQSPRDNT